MSDGTIVPVRKELSSWQRILLGVVFGIGGLCAVAILINFGKKVLNLGGDVMGHDGPTRMISLGINRFQSCKYAGNFLGGAGFDCIVKNVSTDEPRSSSDMACAGFDDQNRMVHSANRVADLYNSGLMPNEERVVRIYFPKETSVAVCSDTGDLGSPARLQKLMPELQRSKVVQEIDL
ncbi:hypothetical protein [Dyella sp. 20L07]|uniref:hypothetical protein n=1 Tax=Dyella sp. 20L07 TaxID=3384240 RepID=UPI003D2B4664